MRPRDRQLTRACIQLGDVHALKVKKTDTLNVPKSPRDFPERKRRREVNLEGPEVELGKRMGRTHNYGYN